MKRWAAGGIILSSVAIKYQLGLVFHAGSLIVPLSASMPHGTWESAMNAAVSASTSPANEAGDFSLFSEIKTPSGGNVAGPRVPRAGCLLSRGHPVPPAPGQAGLVEIP